jgi:hypothetical protein
VKGPADGADTFGGMRGGRGSRRRALVALIVVVTGIELAVGAVVVLGGQDARKPASAPPLHPVAGSFKPDARTLEECAEGESGCVEQAYGNIAFRQGPAAALRRFDEQYADGSDPSCHRVAHTIGSATLSRNRGNVAKTFAQGSSSCWSGYYHGVLERALLGVRGYQPEKLAAVSRDLCADEGVRAVAWLAYQCLHGLGHGLMITTGYNLPLALKVCNRLAADWDQESCKGGAFMENISTSYGVRSRWVRDEDPVYPCNSVAPDDKSTCYQLVTSRVLQVVGVEWERVAEICAGVERGWKGRCFESMGRDVSTQSHREPERIVDGCAAARPHGGEQDCIRFAAMDMTANFTGGAEAAGLCTGTAASLRGSCFAAIGSITARFHATEEARERSCREIAVTGDDLTACLRGGTDAMPQVVEG